MLVCGKARRSEGQEDATITPFAQKDRGKHLICLLLLLMTLHFLSCFLVSPPDSLTHSPLIPLPLVPSVISDESGTEH